MIISLQVQKKLRTKKKYLLPPSPGVKSSSVLKTLEQVAAESVLLPNSRLNQSQTIDQKNLERLHIHTVVCLVGWLVVLLVGCNAGLILGMSINLILP